MHSEITMQEIQMKPGQPVIRNIARAMAMIVLTACVQLSHAKSEIVSNGESQGGIVIPDEPPDIVKYAAKELQWHIEKMTGAKLDIYQEHVTKEQNGLLISLGETRLADAHGVSTTGLEADGYRIRSVGDMLFILGRDYTGPPLGDRKGRTHRTYNKQLKLNAHGETGTLNGVYHFLRDLGFRWYMPGEIGMVIPGAATVDISGRDAEGAPHYTYRKLHGFNFDEDPEAAIWYKRVGFGSVRYINLNHSFTDWAEKYAEKHPEYFAVIDGRSHLESVPDKKRVALNYTEPGVLEQVVEDARKYFEKNPDEPIYPVVPNDSHRVHDEGEETLSYIKKARYSPGWLSDLVWGFVNKAAKRIYEHYPDKLIGSLAYAYQFEAPTMIDEFSPNVVVMHSRKRLWFWDSEYKKHVWKNLHDYTRLNPAEQYIWEYYNLRSRDTKQEWIPFVSPRMIAEDIKELKPYSSGEFIQAKQSRETNKLVKPGLYHLNLYVTARALWDPDLDIEQLLDEYYREYYGPAAEPMRQFWEELENLWVSQKGFMDRTEYLDPAARYRQRSDAWKYYWQEVYSWDKVSVLYNYLQQAKEAANGSKPYQMRVKFIEDEFFPFFTIARRLAGIEELPVADAIYTDRAPVLDGELDDEIWKRTAGYLLKDDVLGEEDSPVTRWQAVHDEKMLYMSIYGGNAKYDFIAEKKRPRDDKRIWKDSAIHVFIGQPEKVGKFYRIDINKKGDIYDGIGYDTDADWDSGITMKTGRSGDAWMLEMAIPMEKLGVRPGGEYHFNVYRTHNENNKHGASSGRLRIAQWSPSYGMPGRPHQFGKIKLMLNSEN